MPAIRPITDLRNTNEISKMCHAKNEPIFILENYRYRNRFLIFNKLFFAKI